MVARNTFFYVFSFALKMKHIKTQNLQLHYSNAIQHMSSRLKDIVSFLGASMPAERRKPLQ